MLILVPVNGFLVKKRFSGWLSAIRPENFRRLPLIRSLKGKLSKFDERKISISHNFSLNQPWYVLFTIGGETDFSMPFRRFPRALCALLFMSATLRFVRSFPTWIMKCHDMKPAASSTKWQRIHKFMQKTWQTEANQLSNEYNRITINKTAGGKSEFR